MPGSTLERFSPLLADWFTSRVGVPTEIQELAWELIAEGRHCLISAATGSGKTLAAFLWSLNQLAAGEWETGATRVVYISPLKALNNDIRRNLLRPLKELADFFESRGQTFPKIRVMTRSGDTEQSQRRKMLRQPPEILITTPESLNLLLTSREGQRSLLGVQALILDEIHSVVSGKRGVYLMTAVERLARLSGEFQRIALSATVRPMETVATFVGGLVDGKPRPVSLAQSRREKAYEISIVQPDEIESNEDDDNFWLPVVADLKRGFERHASTLVFVNSRRLCEKIAHLINSGEESPLAYSHHGSLSKEIRLSVEQRLKEGQLKAIVATNSLEMGIDVGAIDHVVMVQSPNSISSAIQKAGRAGHQVGATSRASLYPSHNKGFLEAAVLAGSIRERSIESIKPIEGPLDVLCQVVISTLGAGEMSVDDVYVLVRRSYSYRDLSRELFDLVIDLLAGRYAGTRMRELKPRISIDRDRGVATLRKGALLAYYFSGGVIPDRGYFQMKLSGSGAKVGELDEEFVWEQEIGSVFTLGVQTWKIDEITFNDVFVRPAPEGEMAPPFWRAERYDRDFHFSERISTFLEWVNEEREKEGFLTELKKRFYLSETSAATLSRFINRQVAQTGCVLPHRHHILAEIVDTATGGAPGKQMVLHTFWGGRVNRPFALALDAAWLESFGHRTEVYVNDDCVVITLMDEVDPESVLKLVDSSNLESLLRKRLEGSGFFGARFREAAGISLLVTRHKAGQRLPLWLSRMKSKKLFESVQGYGDFPLLLETWRTCLKDEFDMENLRTVLGELECGEIGVSFTRTSVASPFAADVAWRQINDDFMYATDSPEASGESKLNEDLVRNVAFDEAARPVLARSLVEQFERKRQRREPGYAPADCLELKEWLRDRIALPRAEWVSLLKDADVDPTAISTQPIGSELNPWLCLSEEAPRAESLFSVEPDEEALAEFLSYFGPVSLDWIQENLGAEGESLESVLSSLLERRLCIRGHLVESEGDLVCDAQNYEALLRMRRAQNRPVFQELPAHCLIGFLARWQGLESKSRSQPEALVDALERLVGWTTGIEEWEESVLPARVDGYTPAALDSVLGEYGLLWYGASAQSVGFGSAESMDLLQHSPNTAASDDGNLMESFASGAAYDFENLKDRLSLASQELEVRLWEAVWNRKVSNTSLVALRRASKARFRVFEEKDELERPRSSGRLGRRISRSRSVSYPGNWYALPIAKEAEDALEILEREKERARILLDRYGVVFRELLHREELGFRWKEVFKALRYLELAGEIVGGRFFAGVDGLQFASKEALRKLSRRGESNEVYWMSARDPASLCGVDVPELKQNLPERRQGTTLVFKGDALAAVAFRGGKSIEFRIRPDDTDFYLVVECLSTALKLGPIANLPLEQINDEPAGSSEYLESLELVWRLHRDPKKVMVEGRR